MVPLHRAWAMFSTQSGDVEGLRAQARHDAGIDADAARVLGESHVANLMVFVLEGLLAADGAREGWLCRKF